MNEGEDERNRERERTWREKNGRRERSNGENKGKK